MASSVSRLPTHSSTSCDNSGSSTSSNHSGALFSLFTPDEFSQVAPFLLAQSFTPAPHFAGPRQGCVFRLGVLGLGYYPDSPLRWARCSSRSRAGPSVD